MKNLTDFIRFGFREILLFPLKLLFWMHEGKWKFWKKKSVKQDQTTTASYRLLPPTSTSNYTSYAMSGSFILTGSNLPSSYPSGAYSSGAMSPNESIQQPKPVTINTHIFKE